MMRGRQGGREEERGKGGDEGCGEEGGRVDVVDKRRRRRNFLFYFNCCQSCMIKPNHADSEY